MKQVHQPPIVALPLEMDFLGKKRRLIEKDNGGWKMRASKGKMFSSLYDSSPNRFWILSNNEYGVEMELLKG